MTDSRSLSPAAEACLCRPYPSSQKGGSQLYMLATGLRTSIEYARQRPFLRAILAQDPRLLSCPRDPREREEPQRLLDYRALVEPLLERAIAMGEVRADLDPAQLARVIWLIHDGLVRAIFINRSAYSDALVETAIELLSVGLRVDSQDPPENSPDLERYWWYRGLRVSSAVGSSFLKCCM
jgi:hypothetical protein